MIFNIIYLMIVIMIIFIINNKVMIFLSSLDFSERQKTPFPR